MSSPLVAVILAADPAEENPLVPKLGEVVIGTIAFGILVAVLLWKAFPALEKVYAERRDRIEGGIERAELAQREAQQSLDSYRDQLAQARVEAGGILEEARERAREIINDATTRADAEAAERRARAEEQMRAERTQIVNELRREIGTVALDLAERIVGHELSRDDRQHQLINDFIADLERQPAHAPANATVQGA